MGDPVTTLKGIVDKPEVQEVLGRYGISTVGDFKDLFSFKGIRFGDIPGNLRRSQANKGFVNSMKAATNYTQGKQNEAVSQADDALPGLPLVIDHRTANETNGPSIINTTKVHCFPNK